MGRWVIPAILPHVADVLDHFAVCGWNRRPAKQEQICFSCLSTISTGHFSVVLTKTMIIGGLIALMANDDGGRYPRITVGTLTTYTVVRYTVSC